MIELLMILALVVVVWLLIVGNAFMSGAVDAGWKLRANVPRFYQGVYEWAYQRGLWKAEKREQRGDSLTQRVEAYEAKLRAEGKL